MPDLYLDDIYCISPEMLLEKGIKAVLLDIDNTLVTYDDPMPTESVLKWLGALSEAGIKAAFISNNHKERVELYNEKLGCPAFYDSGKPFKKACRRALEAMEVTAKEAAIIGDQVFTDVVAGRNAGLGMAILVKPIKDKTNLFFKTKRLLEKPVIRTYNRRQKKKEK